MTIPIIARFAMRTLGRNTRRTALSVVSVGIGVAITVFMTAFMRGSSEMRVRAIAESGFGHIRVAPAGWVESRDNDLRLVDWKGALKAVLDTEGVSLAAPHARATALLAFGTKVAGVEMLGVDPSVEVKSDRLARAVAEGRYLEAGDADAVVIGRTIAERLDVGVDDDLLLTVAASGGQMEYAMLRIVGLISTGSRDMDASICHVMLEDVERLTGLPGAGEISVTLTDPSEMDRVVGKLTDSVPPGDEVLTWFQVVPGQGGDYKSDQGFMNLLAVTVMAVAILGIAGAQLTAMLERRREFAVLIALGMRSAQVIRLILLESATMALMGGAAGLLLATPLVHRIATRGFDFSRLMGGDSSISGVLFDPVIYADMGPWMIRYAFAVAFVAMFFAALYPAWYALRTDPTSALSLREA